MASKLGNITFDCHDPQLLAEFWAAVFGYPKPAFPPGMREQLVAGGATDDDLTSRSVAEDPGGVGPRLFFQRVPEGKVVKNRVHLDIRSTPGERATPEQIEAEKDRVVALGATVSHLHQGTFGPWPEYHYVMRDPEGNEFCIE